MKSRKFTHDVLKDMLKIVILKKNKDYTINETDQGHKLLKKGKNKSQERSSFK